MFTQRQRNLKKAVFAGLCSGTVLGLFLKVMEQWTTFKVYTLLLNIDYIPLLNRIHFPEIVEFIFHLVISILLSMVLISYLQTRNWPANKQVRFVTIIGIVVGVLLYPTTLLSERTPEFTSLPSLVIWLIGHALYGWLLGVLLTHRSTGRE